MHCPHCNYETNHLGDWKKHITRHPHTTQTLKAENKTLKAENTTLKAENEILRKTLQQVSKICVESGSSTLN